MRILNTPGQWWRPFTATTPQGHRLSGWLCHARKSGVLAGALWIETVDGRPNRQLLAGMPEIPYVEQVGLVVPARPAGARQPRTVAATFTRKLDGTAILFSPLSLRGGQVEVFGRTRGMPVLFDTSFRPWRTLVYTAAGDWLEAIAEVGRSQRATLVFELWGSANRHTVSYEERLALSLHTLVRGHAILPWRTVA